VGVTTLRPSCSAFGFELEFGWQADDEVLYAALTQVERMGVALAAIADDGDFLRLDDREIGVGFVIDFHVTHLEVLPPLTRTAVDRKLNSSFSWPHSTRATIGIGR